MAGWTYATDVAVDFAGIAHSDLQAGKAIPNAEVHDTLVTAGFQIDATPEYDVAKSGGGRCLSFKIADNPDGDDWYTNEYTVSVPQTSESALKIQFAGHITARKTVRQERPLCQAESWVDADIHWSTNVLIADKEDENGNPVLDMKASTPQVTVVRPTTRKNSCAEFLGISGSNGAGQLEFYLSLFTEFLAPAAVEGFPGPSAFFSSLQENINTSVLLPAGSVFFSKKPDIDHDGNFSVELTYKTPTGHPDNEDAYELAGSKLEYAHEETPYSRLVSIPNIDRVFQAQTLPMQNGKKDQPQESRTHPAPLAAPMIDKITLTTAGSQHTDGLKATVSSELMKNVQQAMPVAPSSDFDVVKDSSGSPVIFTIGSKGSFHMFQGMSGNNPAHFLVAPCVRQDGVWLLCSFDKLL
ncbi:hypothetical protein F4801DRAFT_597308 [Xylaria longipes]|nr:hypothetical protein F4801DRAFT_597308 [Xylaria longipes]